MTPPLPSTRSPKLRTASTISGSVFSVGMISMSFKYRGGLKKCVPTKRRLNSSVRPSEMLCSGMPEVLVEIMAFSFAKSSTRCMSSLFGSSFSMMASTIQSASPMRPKCSSKFPVLILSATFSAISAAGLAFFILSKPAFTTAFLSSSSSGTISSRSTSSPAFAQWAAMAAPIVPAPSTATFLILSVELSVQRLDSLSYPQEVDLESALDLGVLLFPARRYLVEAPAPGIRPLPLPLHVPLLLEPPEQGVDRVRRDAHRPRADLAYLRHDAVPVTRPLPHDVQNEQRKDVPRLDLAQEDVLRRRPLYRPPLRFLHRPGYPPIENLSKLRIARIISLRKGLGPYRVGIRRVQAKEECE